MTGYSGTPLVRKLGIKVGMTLLAINAPPEYRDWLGDLPPDALVVEAEPEFLVAIHLFVGERATLERELQRFRSRLVPNGFIWVSWPKRAAKVPTDITEDVIRDVALPLGFVDIKVASVSDIWSGLKLVIRKNQRQPWSPD